MKPNEIIPAFDLFLVQRKETFQGIVIGGSALAVMGVIGRETRDVDIISPDIPDKIKKHSEEFALEINRQHGDEVLDLDWLNNGPAEVGKELPEGWQKRIQLLFQGKAVTFHTLGRSDLVKSKLLAFCYRPQDRGDVFALKPLREELLEAWEWLKDKDGNQEYWLPHIEGTLREIAKGRGYEL